MKNPFASDPRYRLELAYKLIPKNTKTILDYGCSDGLFLSKIKAKISRAKLFGYDVDRKKITNAKRLVPSATFNTKLGKESVDLVTLLDVIEHVPDEMKVIRELYRVLKPGGSLLLSTPHRGLTETFDPGNIKFRFPSLHRFLYEKVFKQSDYDEKFSGILIGDISPQKKLWHRHYSKGNLEKLLISRFKIKNVYYFGLMFPVLSMIDQAYSWALKKDSKLLKRLVLLDSRARFGKFSFSIFIHAIKK